LICVLTHPRPGASYLTATLAAIDASATGARAVVTDTVDPLTVPRGWELVRFERPKTERPENRWALWRCFLLAYERGEDLIVCEDDITLCRNGAVHAELLAVPSDVAWISLYDPHFRASAPRGLHRMPARLFSFAQMIKFPLRTCALMRAIGCELFERIGSDDQLGALGGMMSLTYAIHVPSLAQHVGAVSAVGNGDLSGRTSHSFRADYDPLTEDRRTFQ
jgi:hypothetical protein